MDSHPRGNVQLVCDQFETITQNAFNKSMIDKNFADVTLACDDDKQILAHKIILGASSSFFMNLLVKNHHPHPLIYLRGVKYDELEYIINYIYTGKVNIQEEMLNRFLSVSRDLEIAGFDKQETLEMDGDLEMKNKTIMKENVGDQNVETIFSQDKIVIKEEKIEFNENNTEANSEVPNLLEKCDKCPYETRLFFELMTHIKSNHAQDESIKTKDDQKDKSLLYCNLCEFTAKHSSGLRYHKSTMHEGVRYPCDQCAFKSTSKNGLITHAEIRHGGILFPCSTCDYKATSRKFLRRHLSKRHHSSKNIKMFVAAKVSKKIVNKEKEQSIVQKDKKLSCNFCGRTFKRSTNLKQHIMGHTGIFAFNCTKCKKGFRRRERFTHHECSQDGSEQDPLSANTVPHNSD